MTEGVPWVPPDRACHPTHQLGGDATILMRWHSQKVTDLRPLEVLVVHDGREPPMATMPLAMVPPTHALRGNVSGGGELRPVQALATHAPETDKELVVREP